ncbi:hypothetical protein [Cupriavidus sp. TMH.W2]|uniref:hypothetical protein n=1 Tax=Cupriavidus sp. TMH.W2 TaxID=3434465 RepID=UPI003D780FDC
MAIRDARQSPVTEADIGKYLCVEPMIVDQICSRPWQITELVKTRIHVQRIRSPERDRDVETKYFYQKSVLFVCDSQAEGEALVALGWAQRKALEQARENVLASYQRVVSAALAGQAVADAAQAAGIHLNESD